MGLSPLKENFLITMMTLPDKNTLITSHLDPNPKKKKIKQNIICRLSAIPCMILICTSILFLGICRCATFYFLLFVVFENS